MQKIEKVSLALTMAVAASVVTVQAARRPAAHPKPRATIALQMGDQVSVNGTLYTVTAGLTPVTGTPTPVPVPMPTPTPTPNPNPNPTPAPDMVVFEFRDARRNPAMTFVPGTTIWIEGANFGSTVGVVKVNHAIVPTQSWKDREIEIICPSLPIGSQTMAVALDILRADNKSWVSTIGFTIIKPPGAKNDVPRRP